MKIKAIHKTTLIDYPDKIACTIFLHGCNFKCGFCHNPELVISDDKSEVSQEEVFNFLEKRKGQLEGVCISGGEPLLSLEKEFVRKIKDMGYFVKIDTNGSFPERLKEFIEEKLVDFVSMDVKGIKEDYSHIVNCNVNFEDLEKSIKLISEFDNYEFRTTIIEGVHTKEKIMKLGEWLIKITGEKPERYVLQGFKNQGKLIDSSFRENVDSGEEYLIGLKDVADNFFGSVGVRV